MPQDGPRTLLYDIETAPSLAYVWSLRDIDHVVDVESDWYMLSFAWRWLGEKRTHVLGLDDFPGYARDPENDKRLVKELHKLFDEADITIGHNGDSFDRRKSNARFLVHGLNPPSPYRTVDTLKIARRHFAFSSNRLDDLGRTLGVGRKASTGGWKTWRGCMAGDPAAWATMKQYNKQDVDLLERVYLKLRPWAENHPNMGLIAGVADGCPKCGTRGKMVRRGSFRSAQSQVYQRYRCQACGGYSHSRTAEQDRPRPEFVG